MEYRSRRLRRSDDNLDGLDDWLMTYADMITLLLCFFALLLSVSVPKREVFEQARERVLEKFATAEDQIILLSPTSTGGRTSDNSILDGQPSIIEAISPHDKDKDKDKDKEHDHDKTKDHDAQSPDPSQASPKDIPTDGAEGNWIDIIDIPSAAFFASGSASLSEAGKTILLELLDTHLMHEDRRDYQITIEGHTDDVPISTLQFPSNWELSTARAASVVRYLIEHGIEPQRLRAAGYADTFPKVPNRTARGIAIPDNQAQNRRVLIKLEKIK